MTADIIDISTRKKWSPERTSRAARILAGASRADCTAPYFDLIFFEDEEAADLRLAEETAHLR